MGLVLLHVHQIDVKNLLIIWKLWKGDRLPVHGVVFLGIEIRLIFEKLPGRFCFVCCLSINLKNTFLAYIHAWFMFKSSLFFILVNSIRLINSKYGNFFLMLLIGGFILNWPITFNLFILTLLALLTFHNMLRWLAWLKFNWLKSVFYIFFRRQLLCNLLLSLFIFHIFIKSHCQNLLSILLLRHHNIVWLLFFFLRLF